MRTIWLIVGVCVIAGCASEPPAKTVWPEVASNPAMEKGNGTFGVGTNALGQLSYQWYFNQTNIAGASGATVVSNAPPATQTTRASDADHPEAAPANSAVSKTESRTGVQEPAFEDYDHEVINTIQKRWQELRSNYPAAAPGHTKGKVVVNFRLHADGRIGVVKTVSSDVDGVLTYLCEQAVKDPAPYPRWPEELVRKVGTESREIRFTFSYE
jgi:outer membrane biosynthesis protein TonB